MCISCINLSNHKLYKGQEITNVFFKSNTITLLVSVYFEVCQIFEYADLIFLYVSNYTVARYLPLSNDHLNINVAKDIPCVSSKGKGPILLSIIDNPIYFPILHIFHPSLLVDVTVPSSLTQKTSELALLILMINIRSSSDLTRSLLTNSGSDKNHTKKVPACCHYSLLSNVSTYPNQKLE